MTNAITRYLGKGNPRKMKPLPTLYLSPGATLLLEPRAAYAQQPLI